MRTCLIALSVFALLPLAGRAAETPDDILTESLQVTNELADILKTVKDKASAEAAAPKLKALDGRAASLKKKQATLEKLPVEELKKLRDKYKESFDKMMKTLVPEVERIDKLTDVKAALTKESTLYKDISEGIAEEGKAKTIAAKLKIRTIETAVAGYKLKSGEFPKDLKALTEGKEPYLKKEDLTDPWDKPYQYDPKGPKHKGDKPDVWTVAPDKKVIGNWDEVKK